MEVEETTNESRGLIGGGGRGHMECPERLSIHSFFVKK
jgi:hypothetical protein